MNVDMKGIALIRGALDAPLAWRNGQPISRRRYLADVHALAERLPESGSLLNITADRYRFALGLGAAMLRGHSNLMPPNHTPDTVARLRGLFPGAYALTDVAGLALQLPTVGHATEEAPDRPGPVPLIDADALVAHVLTSGSTGAPLPHAKRWGLLARNTEAGARRLAEQMSLPSLDGVTLVATVPAQHMYGFESTVLLALLGGAAFEADRPFYPADIARALTRAARPRMLVTTPFHLKTLLDSGIALPAIDLTLCATAPLSPQLALRAEAALAAPLLEIYGCTEAGQVASRRTVAGAEWRVYDGLRLTGDGDQAVVQGGHVPQPTLLSDVLEVLDGERFRLLSRSNDLVNIAGKRSSLGHLNYHLNSIAGVQDGAFWLPPDDPGASVVRPVAFVVGARPLRATFAAEVLAALRQRVDAAFLPRRIVLVDALPREAGTAKLPASLFASWAGEALRQSRADQAHADRPAAASPAQPSRIEIQPKSEPRWQSTLRIECDHPAFAGHFPGQPLLPGVSLLAEVLEAVLDEPALAAIVGDLPRIGTAKFLAPVRPGAQLTIRFDAGPTQLRFEVRDTARPVASGQFEAAG